ncbi:hypothetical protein QTG54_009803, partial [Skeletonema marinoi]
MALTRNSPIKSDPPAMTKPSSSSPPPPALSLDDDNVTTDKVSSSPSLKRRKIVDDGLEQKKIPAADTNKSQNKNSMAPAVAAATLTTHAASAAASANMETIDVANILGLKPGDRIEVKWNINDEEEEDDPPPPPAVETGKRLGLPKTEGEEDEGRGDVETLPLKSTNTAKTDNTKNAQDTTNSNSNSSSPAPPGMISVWWKATVQKASGEYHILDDNDESAGSPLKAAVQQPPPPPPTAASSSSTDKNQTYNCPKCSKQNMSKQGLYTHYGMVHGGKISRDYPNLLSQQQQQQQQHYSNKTTEQLPTVRIPIYEIVYDPLPSLGFPDYSNEEVAFISNVTLLNLSSEEMMNFRREGEVASPLVESGVIGVGVGDGVGVGKEGNALMKDVGGGGGLTGIFGNEAAATAGAASKPTATTTTASATSANTSTNPNEIYKEFRSEDDIRTYMNELMQKSMMSTGMNARMATLPRSQQNVIAGRINKALEGLLGKMMEEMG